MNTTTKKVQKAKNVVKESTPLEDSIQLTRYLNIIGSVCGVDIIRADYHINYKTYFVFTAIMSFFMFAVYTFYLRRHDTFLLLQTGCFCAFVVPATKKLESAMKHRLVYNSLFQFSTQLSAANPEGPRAKIIKNCFAATVKLAKLGILALLFSTIVYASYPLYLFLIKGEHELIITVMIPFLDHETLTGFIFTTLVHIIFTTFAAAGNIAYDLYFHVTVGNYIMVIELLNESLQNLGKMWSTSNKIEVAYKKAFMKNITILFQDIDRYICMLNDLVEPIVLIQVFMLALAISVSLLCVIASNWISGVGFAAFLLTQVLLVGYLGTLVQTGNDRLRNVIYDTPWYNFPVEDQKMILFLMIRANNMKELWVGTLAPLNYETTSEILKVIYNMLMMLVNTLT